MEIFQRLEVFKIKTTLKKKCGMQLKLLWDLQMIHRIQLPVIQDRWVYFGWKIREGLIEEVTSWGALETHVREQEQTVNLRQESRGYWGKWLCVHESTKIVSAYVCRITLPPWPKLPETADMSQAFFFFFLITLQFNTSRHSYLISNCEDKYYVYLVRG